MNKKDLEKLKDAISEKMGEKVDLKDIDASHIKKGKDGKLII